MDDKLLIRKTCKRYNEPGDIHELTFSCFQRRAFLSKDRTRFLLRDAILQAKEKHEFDLWAYVFMPEHAHILIWPRREEYSIEGILKSIKQSAARKAVEYLRRHNPAGLKWLATGEKARPYRFWQAGGGYDRNVIQPATLWNSVQYIHDNPVRRHLARYAQEWYWSSAREWEVPGTGPLPIDRESFPTIVL
jgi:putative transposase